MISIYVEEVTLDLSLIQLQLIESLLNALKCKIKQIYRIISSKNFVSYLREAEWKYLNKDKSYEGKIKEFFSCFKFLNDVNDVKLEKNEFLSDEKINDGISSDKDSDEMKDESD